MHIVLVSGSHRQLSESAKVARYVAGRLEALAAGTTTDIIELTGNPLPLWDGQHTKPGTPSHTAWAPMAERLRKADALVIVSPEWHGMVPAGLKNFFLFASAAEVGHKPALIVAVSASRGGSYPISELRMSSTKNNRMLYIPEHVIVQNAGLVLNGQAEEQADDAYIRRRIDFAARILLEYGKALAAVRASGMTSHPDFVNGM